MIMPTRRTQRVRDPVHGLIVFDKDDPIDQLAWALLDTPEFQRLRRIKQLGVSEFVFPSATHTRFAHCIGVFHTARRLIKVIHRELGADFKLERGEIALIAALLHDLGHGPFSHTFEGVQKSRNVTKRHETWTAEIILNPAGAIRPLLESHRPDSAFCTAVADLVAAEDPMDIYHAVVSSSFDADRLDYLRRDRLMTGTGAGAIDFDWLMEHVRVRNIEIEAADAGPEEDPVLVPTFCFHPKALPAAEQFLRSRYALHEQVYFHKTTRCVEQMIAKLLRRVAALAEKSRTKTQTGLDVNDPLMRFFRKDGATIANYLALDDVGVMSAIERMRRASDPEIKALAVRLHERRLYKALDLGAFGYDDGKQRAAARRIDTDFRAELSDGKVLKDEGAAISIYTQIGGDDERAHKRLHVLDNDKPLEITTISKAVESMRVPKKFTRYYFEDEIVRDRAIGKRGGL
jgi:uncharacterized protein